jgi:hypothetical protein
VSGAKEWRPTEWQIERALAVLLWLSEQREGDGRLRDAIAQVRMELHDELDPT